MTEGLLIFRQGEVHFSLAVEKVFEVIDDYCQHLVTDEPPEGASGLMNWHQDVVPLYSPQSIYELPGNANDKTVLVVGTTGPVAALIVSSAEGIYPLSAFQPVALSPVLRETTQPVYDRLLEKDGTLYIPFNLEHMAQVYRWS